MHRRALRPGPAGSTAANRFELASGTDLTTPQYGSVALCYDGTSARWRVLGKIGAGWVLTPVIAAFVCFVGLFFLQNVFQQEVYREADAGAPAVHGEPPAAGFAAAPEARLVAR